MENFHLIYLVGVDTEQRWGTFPCSAYSFIPSRESWEFILTLNDPIDSAFSRLFPRMLCCFILAACVV